MLIPNTLVVSEETVQQNGTDAGPGGQRQLSGTGTWPREDTGAFAAITEDIAGAAGKPVLSGVTAAAPDDPAERWPADSGTDPWAAQAGADDWAASEQATGWGG